MRFLIILCMLALAATIASAKQIPIGIQINDTHVVVYDSDNNRVFPVGNSTTAFDWKVNTTDTNISNITAQLDVISSQITTRCSNISIAEIREVVNARLDTKLSEFGDSLDAKLTPLADYGDKFKDCQLEIVNLNNVINSRDVNETQLRGELANTRTELKYTTENYNWSSGVAVFFGFLTIFWMLLSSGGIAKMRQYFGGKI